MLTGSLVTKADCIHVLHGDGAQQLQILQAMCEHNTDEQPAGEAGISRQTLPLQAHICVLL